MRLPLFVRSIVIFTRPLRSIANELIMLRRLYEMDLASKGLVLPKDGHKVDAKTEVIYGIQDVLDASPDELDDVPKDDLWWRQ